MNTTDVSLLDDTPLLQQYLITHGLLSRGEAIQVASLGGGVSNKIIKVIAPTRTLVIKQAQPKLRVAVDWYASVDRVLIEAECMREVGKLLPPGTVPEIYFIDKERYIYAMECAPEGSILWKTDLLDGRVDLRTAAYVGRILGAIHGRTCGDGRLAEKFWDNHILHDLRLDPLLVYLAQIYPALAPQMMTQAKSLDTNKRCLVHGDYTPKNMLRHDDRLVLLDYEIAHWGDPALDSAFMLAHLLLKSVRAPQWCDRYLAAARAFWSSYTQACTAFQAEDLEAGAAQLVPFLVLARIDSKSPVEYLPTEGAKQAARDLAIRHIVHATSSLEELYSCVHDMAERQHSAGLPAQGGGR